MPTAEREIETLANREYKWGFVTDIDAESAPPGLNEDIVRFISAKKVEPGWLLDLVYHAAHSDSAPHGVARIVSRKPASAWRPTANETPHSRQRGVNGSQRAGSSYDST